MATVLELNAAAPTSIMAIVEYNPVVVLIDTDKREGLFAEIRRDMEAFEADVTTAKGRDAIRSFARKIVTTKTAIDAAGKGLNEAHRSQINAVDAERRACKSALEEMAEEARRPLTEWEDAEKLRVAQCESIMEDFRDLAHVSLIDDSISVRERGTKVWETELDPAVFGDRLESAQAAKDGAMATLQAALARLVREEADKAELQRLRDEAAARAEADRIAYEAAEAKRLADEQIEADRIAAEQAKAEGERQAEIAEERRIANEQAEAKRIEDAKAEAAALAERQAQAAAKAEQDKRDAEHARQLAEAQEERDRIAAREAERVAEQEAEAAEQARRDKNRAHRAQIMGQAKIAIMAAANEGHAVEHPITEAAAVAIVKAIVNGFIPNVTLRF